MQSKIGTGEAAEILGVSCQSVRNWLKEGRLQATTNESGRFQFDRKEVIVLAGEMAPLIEVDGTIDPNALYKQIHRRIICSPTLVRTLVERGCDKNGVIQVSDAMTKGYSRDKWEAEVHEYRLNLSTALGEMMAAWSYKDWTPAQDARFGELTKALTDFMTETEFDGEVRDLPESHTGLLSPVEA